ncbi:hypothetical protein [Flavobacterium chungangensis]|uniref:Sugar-binding protein n=1 Tax=Flavobacterium chungangensis TaxID=2708132 RepID=A0ABV8ZKB6_9FLAO
MKFIIKYCFLNLILFSFITNAQNIEKRNTLYNQKSEANLKGPVKSSQVYYSQIDENLSLGVKNYIFLQHNASFYKYLYLDLDKNGYGKINIVDLLVKKDTPLNLKAIYVNYIDYDSIDRKNKEKYKSYNKKYFPINDYYLLIQANNTYSSSEESETTATINTEIKPQLQYIYKYNFDSNNRIKEEITYIKTSTDHFSKSYKLGDFDTKKIYLYNEKDQIISQKIIQKYGSEFEETQVKYKYDLKGRISQVQFYDVEGNIASSEEYLYNSTEDYIEKVKYYSADKTRENTSNTIKTFNKGGDEIEKEFIPEYPEQTFFSKHFFYSYEYDNYNNWIKCNVFLDNKKEGIPTLVMERKIEYYN